MSVIGESPASLSTATHEGRALTAGEARRLLNVASHHRLGAWIVTALTLGLRPGETSGLCWDSVDLDSGLVIVHRSLGWVGNEPSLKETKTKRPRTLDAPVRAADVLRDHLKLQVEERLTMGDLWPAKRSDLVFLSEAGTPLIPSNLRRLVSTLATEADIEGKVTPYDLRHSATSLLSASGVAPELLADMLGHRDTRMVHKHLSRGSGGTPSSLRASVAGPSPFRSMARGVPAPASMSAVSTARTRGPTVAPMTTPASSRRVRTSSVTTTPAIAALFCVTRSIQVGTTASSASANSPAIATRRASSIERSEVPGASLTWPS